MFKHKALEKTTIKTSSVGTNNMLDQKDRRERICITQKSQVTVIAISLLCLLFGINTAKAQELGDLSNSYDLQKLGGMASRLSVHGDGLMGDLVDKNTGGVTFEHTDVSIPGNSSLEVALRRKVSQGNQAHTPYQQGFSGWVIDLPIAYTAYAPNGSAPTFNNGCLTNYGPMRLDSTVGGNGVSIPINWAAFTSGVTLHVPGTGVSGFQADPKNPQDPKTNWVSKPNTTDHANRCATLVVAPDGTKYKFGRHAIRKADAFRVPYWYFSGANQSGQYLQAQASMARNYAVYLVTEVEDVNGNWVRYEYTNDARAELTRIHSNDGRQIDVAYSGSAPSTRNSRRVSQVTANGRTWSYGYASNFYLYTVTLPDGRFWRLGDSTDGMREMSVEVNIGYKCLPFDNTFTMKHPDGAIGEFQLFETRHIKGAADLGSQDDDFDHYMAAQNIPFVSDNSACAGTLQNPKFSRPIGWPIYRAMSLKTKTISGSGLPTATWSYQYRNYSGGTLDQNWTKITGPDGTERKYTHHAVGLDHGLLERVDVTPTSGSGESVAYQYNLTAPVSSSCETGGDYGDSSGLCHAFKQRPATQITQQRNGDTYTTLNTYNQNGANNFIDYGYPNRERRNSTITDSTVYRDTVTTYEHKTGINVIGLTKKVVQNGRELATYAYDSLGRRTSQTRYGQAEATFTYHNIDPYKGALASTYDALGREVYRSDYKRGVPQDTRRPDNRTLSVTIDNNGWLMDSTDAMGNTTSYSRDNMGRLTLINLPGSWTNTSVAYNFSGGGVVQTINRGQSRETITYDKLYRPVLEHTQALDTSWASYIKTTYHPAGQVKFKSQASTSSNESKGVDYTYDGLGRITQERENVSPLATVTHNYFDEGRHRVVDPSGAFTEYYSYGYEGAGNTDYRAIYRYADGAWRQYTYLYKDVHGQLTRLRQWGSDSGYSVDQSQYYYYDGQQRLCRHYVPEQGATKYQYDAAGQMVAYAKGQSNSGCGAVPASSAKVTQSYDAVGRPAVTDFSDSATPNISRTYDFNGNVLTNNRAGVDWTYTYDTLNHLTSEKLDVDNRSYDLSYLYDTNENLTQRTLPSGRVITYTHDGLGRERSALSSGTYYANSINYHRNSAVSSMTYGNGQAFTQTLNNRLLPLRLRSQKSGSSALDLTYTYDARGDIKTTTDGTDSANYRSYNYDGLGRLSFATGPWGSGSFTYDSLGNIRYKTLGSRQVGVSYNSLNRATQSTDTAGSTRNIGYDSRGNVTSLGASSFTYDHTDQPTKLSGSSTGTYKYDGNLKRVKAKVDGKTIYNVYDASGSLVHVDKRKVVVIPFDDLVIAASVSTPTDYIKVAGMTVARITKDQPTYLHPNHLGSAVAGTTASGSIDWKEQYLPYGEKMIANAANDDQASFTGHIDDSATGLTYMQARYYDPVMGRFLSVDPVGFLETDYDPRYVNRYAYGGNNPISNVDPNGELIWHVVGAGIGAGLNLTAQLISNGGDLGRVNYSQVAVAGIAGAAGVGIAGSISTAVTSAGVTGSSALAANIVGNSAAGAFIGLEATLANAALDEIDGDGGDIHNIGKNVKDGAIFGFVGAVGGEAIIKGVTQTSGKLLGSPGQLNGLGRALGELGSNTAGNAADFTNSIIDEAQELLEE